MRQKIATVYETDEYNLFKLLEGNRPIDHAKRIVESIKEIGVLWQPVLVNEKMEIIDGQGRYLAMKTLGKPIPYIIQPGLNIEHVKYLNQNATKWALKDYIHCYAAGYKDKDSFKNLEVVMRQFPEFNHYTIIRAASQCGIGISDNAAKNLRSGKLDGIDFESMNRAIRRLQILKDITTGVEGLKAVRPMHAAIIFCIYISEIDATFSLKQLAESIKKRANTMSVATTIEKAINNVDSMYNFNRIEKNRYDITGKYEETLKEINPVAYRKMRRKRCS